MTALRSAVPALSERSGQIYTFSSRSSRREALKDIIEGVASYSIWGRMGWAYIRRRYRRTVIGPFWSTLSLGIFVIAMGIIWSNLWNMNPKEYLPYLNSGMLSWVLFSSFVTEGCNVFVSNESLIKQLRISYTILILSMVWHNIIVFFHNMAVYIPIYIYSGLPLGFTVLLAIPALILLCLNGIWIALILGMLCARYRDIQQVVASFLQISMFLTPIFWSPAQLSGRTIYMIHFNVLYHYIVLVRDPLLGKAPQIESWLIVLGATVIGWAAALYMFGKFRQRIPFWL